MKLINTVSVAMVFCWLNSVTAYAETKHNMSAHAEHSQSAHETHLMHKNVSSGVEVHHGWIRLTPPIAKNSAAYFVIHNFGEQDVTIVDVSTPIAKIAAMHNTVIEKSMARMVHLPELLVPAGGRVEFSESGMHLMLVDLTEKLEVDKEVAVTFTLDNGNTVKAQLVIKAEALPHRHDH